MVTSAASSTPDSLFPTVLAVASFLTDLGDARLRHAVAIAEDRLTGSEVVKARPQRRSGGIFDDGEIGAGFRFRLGMLFQSDAGESRGIQPRHRPLDGGDDFCAGVVETHQQAGHADRFRAAE